MIHEVRPPFTATLQWLFAPVAFQRTCIAVLSGDNPGRVLVDDPRRPKAGLVFTAEGAFLCGDAGRHEFCRELAAYLANPAHLGTPVWTFPIIPGGQEWVPCIERIARGRQVEELARRHYVVDSGDARPDLPLPAGADQRRIDRDLFADGSIDRPTHIDRWIQANWGGREAFLRDGFGVVTLVGGRIASWSVCDCASAGICEIGIHTREDSRGQGLGGATASAAVELAFSLGHRSVGWHCHEANIASWKTAERVGFRLEREYTEYAIHKSDG